MNWPKKCVRKQHSIMIEAAGLAVNRAVSRRGISVALEQDWTGKSGSWEGL